MSYFIKSGYALHHGLLYDIVWDVHDLRLATLPASTILACLLQQLLFYLCPGDDGNSIISSGFLNFYLITCNIDLLMQIVLPLKARMESFKSETWLKEQNENK